MTKRRAVKIQQLLARDTDKVMKSSKKYVVPFVIVALAVSLSSCRFGPTSRHKRTTPVPDTTNSKTPEGKSSLTQTTPIQKQASSSSDAVVKQTVNVTLFTSDTQCQELIPQQVSVPAQAPVTGAVGKIIEQRDSADFSVSGYRVTVKDGVATVDLRISPNSQRQFTSLSSCEQFALFGGLRKTLLGNSQWRIKEVRFTERGEKIIF
ncbi:MAG: sporulation/spore germination protein [Scytonema sp. RU_4_4]|nr:sporulation/spore germination protein [Scytonema sp. RU_4_4]NJR74168.1 sporulation/spore germination protein [Scytonema sp. CRU_2_7]